MEGKLSMGLFSSISFNDNAIVRNFYPKKFQSLKLFKDLLPTWRELITFDYRTALDLLSRMSFWLQRNWGKKTKRYWSFSLLLSRESWPKSCERKSLRTRGLYYSPDGVQGGYLCRRKYYDFPIFFPFFNTKFPIFPIFSIPSFLFSYFFIFLINHAAGHPVPLLDPHNFLRRSPHPSKIHPIDQTPRPFTSFPRSATINTCRD